MNFKKLIMLSIVSICVFNPAKGMEEIVKNQVIPAVGIVATGAALGVASNIVFNTIDKYIARKQPMIPLQKLSIAESVLIGAGLTLPYLVGFGNDFSKQNSMQNMLKPCIAAACTFASLMGMWGWYDWNWERKFAANNPPEVVNEDADTMIVYNDTDYLKRQLRTTQICTALMWYYFKSKQ